MGILILIFKVIMFLIALQLMLELLSVLLPFLGKVIVELILWPFEVVVGLLLLPSKVWAWAEARDLRFQEEELIVAEYNRNKGE